MLIMFFNGVIESIEYLFGHQSLRCTGCKGMVVRYYMEM